MRTIDHRLLLWSEVRRVLRDKFGWPEEDLAELDARFPSFTVKVSPTQRLQVVKADPDDDRVLECAVASRSSVIVSGDRHLLDLGQYEGIPIMRVADYLNRAQERGRLERLSGRCVQHRLEARGPGWKTNSSWISRGVRRRRHNRTHFRDWSMSRTSRRSRCRRRAAVNFGRAKDMKGKCVQMNSLSRRISSDAPLRFLRSGADHKPALTSRLFGRACSAVAVGGPAGP